MKSFAAEHPESQRHPKTDSLNTFDEIRKLCSHDMKSPISAILESCALLREESELGRYQTDLVNNIEEAVQSLYNMVDCTHELIRMNDPLLPFAEKPVNIMSVIQRVSSRIHFLLKTDDITLQIHSRVNHLLTSSNVCYVRGEEFHIYTILINLMRILIRFARPQSAVQITLSYDSGAVIHIEGMIRLTERMKEALAGMPHRPHVQMEDALSYYLLQRYLQITGSEIQISDQSDGSMRLILSIPLFFKNGRRHVDA